MFRGLAILLLAGKSQADPVSEWTWRFPNPQGSTLAAVTYGGGQFVAVGDNGTIISSVDGYHWANRSQGAFPFLHGVAYAAGKYAAVGDGGLIVISSDLVNWTPVPSVTTATLRGIAGNSGWAFDGLPQFLAVGDSGVAVSCTGGTNWSVLPTGTSNTLYSVTWASSVFSYICVGAGGTVAGLNALGFSQRPQNLVGTTNDLYSVATSEGRIVAAAGDLSSNPSAYTPYDTNEILYSLNRGNSWTNQQWLTNGGTEDGLWNLSEFFVLTGMAYGASGFVAVGYTGYDLEYHPAVVMVSPTGTNWTELGPGASEDPLNGVTYGNGLYVAVGDFGSIVASADATNWSAVTPDRRGTIIAMAGNSHLRVAAASGAWYSWGFPDLRTLVSSDGSDWVVSATAATLPQIADLACNDSLFVGVSGGTTFATSNGYNWQPSASFSNVLNGVRFLNREFFVVGNNGTIFSSVDGTNWVDHSVAAAGSLNGIAYGDGVYAAAGSVGATSPDGITWTGCPSNPPATITRIVYGRGIFVATAYSGVDTYRPIGHILTSKDGSSWQMGYAEPNGEAFSGIAYSGGTFVAISGFSGVVYKSSDGLTWQSTGSSMPRTTYYPNGYTYPLAPLMPLGLFVYYEPVYPGCYTSVAADGGVFRIAGAEAMLLESGNTWTAASLFGSQPGSNGFSFSYSQQIDVPYRIEASSDLVLWETVFRGIGSGQPTNFAAPSAPGSASRFFRLRVP